MATAVLASKPQAHSYTTASGRQKGSQVLLVQALEHVSC